MVDLLDNQWEVGGVVFGADCPVDVKSDGFKPGAAALRTDDLDMPVTDGVRPGITRKGGASWAFSLFTNQETEEDAWAAVAGLQEPWDADDIRDTPGNTIPLRYRIRGETRRVYGQPRRWEPVVNPEAISGRIDIEADFLVVHPVVYEDQEQSEEFGLQVPFDPAAGVIVPTIVPFTSSSGTVTRQEDILVGGDRPTPVWVTFTGPVDNALVRVGGLWSVVLVDPLPDGETAVVDARPWVMAATRRVSPRTTKLAKMWLPPGRHTVTFTGTDTTGKARVKVSWRNARRSTR